MATRENLSEHSFHRPAGVGNISIDPRSGFFHLTDVEVAEGQAVGEAAYVPPNITVHTQAGIELTLTPIDADPAVAASVERLKATQYFAGELRPGAPLDEVLFAKSAALSTTGIMDTVKPHFVGEVSSVVVGVLGAFTIMVSEDYGDYIGSDIADPAIDPLRHPAARVAFKELAGENFAVIFPPAKVLSTEGTEF